MVTRKDVVVVASRTLALLVTLWALTDLSYLPEYIHTLLRYMDQTPSATPTAYSVRHYEFIRVGFLVTRVIGFALMARWLFQGGPEVEELFLPSDSHENVS